MTPPLSRRSSRGAEGQLWRRKTDGRLVEIVWFAPRHALDRVQVKPADAKNLKNTHWLGIDSLERLYERMATCSQCRWQWVAEWSVQQEDNACPRCIGGPLHMLTMSMGLTGGAQ